MTTQTYSVSGLTCGHCVAAVREEVGAVAGVRSVAVDLVAGGTSTLTVVSAAALPIDRVMAALDEAGDYRLVDD